MACSMLAMAVVARNSLLLCGPLIFREGGTDCIGNYTSGMTSLISLIQRLEACVFLSVQILFAKLTFLDLSILFGLTIIYGNLILMNN